MSRQKLQQLQLFGLNFLANFMAGKTIALQSEFFFVIFTVFVVFVNCFEIGLDFIKILVDLLA